MATFVRDAGAVRRAADTSLNVAMLKRSLRSDRSLRPSQKALIDFFLNITEIKAAADYTVFERFSNTLDGLNLEKADLIRASCNITVGQLKIGREVEVTLLKEYSTMADSQVGHFVKLGFNVGPKNIPYIERLPEKKPQLDISDGPAESVLFSGYGAEISAWRRGKPRAYCDDYRLFSLVSAINADVGGAEPRLSWMGAYSAYSPFLPIARAN